MKSNLTKETYLSLADGVKIPWVGLGTYKLAKGKQTYETVLKALELGYRHLDTAFIYENEEEVGKAVRDSGLKRSEIFVTTKLWNDHQGYEKGKQAFHASLKLLGFDYVDLYLIHWPLLETRLDAWRALVEIKQQGFARSIGVSNFTIPHLEQLLKHSDEVPSVNQVEFSPFLYQKDLLDFCTKHKIYLEAYSPLTRGEKLQHPVLVKIAKKHKRTSAQVILRWALEIGVIVLPKSVSPERLKENISLFDFELDQTDHTEMATLNEDFRISWDPTTLGG